jgi:thiol-disulfide isomerase/thioredoxin
VSGLIGLSLVPFSVAEDKLTIGSSAPELDIEHWIQNGKGKFKPVKKFEAGKVYVVEFWATWCGPCVASMPHLAEMQDRFADKGVQIISVSTESMDIIDQFLDRKVGKGEKGKEQTFRDLTSAYCLTTDPDASTEDAYMAAAGQDGIPCAFIVGKDQKIEWIGHPGEMDEPLEEVVSNRWDRKAFAEMYKEKKASEELRSRIVQYLQTGRAAKAIELIDEALTKTKDKEFMQQLRMTRVSAIFQLPKVDADMRKAIESSLEEFGDDADFVNFVAWSVYEKTSAGDWKDKELVKSGRAAIEKAISKIKDDSSKASALDTVAHLQHLEGDIASALRTQKAAVALASGDLKQELNEFLKELEAAKK